jgi:hypothetical protein
MAILPENEYTEFENRDYINPQVSLDEQNAFVDKLRQTQQMNNQQIKTDTYNLGTAVPSNLGGLTGGEGYFTARYQTPQTNTLVNDLRAAAQASAMNQVLENEQAKWKKRYNAARNSNAIRNNNNTGGTTGGNITQDGTTIKIGDIKTEALANELYKRKVMEYIQKGYSAEDADAKAKEDMGIKE